MTATAVQAQTEKGKWMVGGNASYDLEKVQDVDGNKQSYAIQPTVGFFIQDNLALGLGLGYAGNFEKSSTGLETTSGEFTLMPFARMYKGDGNFKFFSQLGVPMAWGTDKVDGDKINTTESYGVAISPGVAYFPTERLGIEFSVKGLYYEYSSVKPEGGSKVGLNQFGLNANSFSPSIGITFAF